MRKRFYVWAYKRVMWYHQWEFNIVFELPFGTYSLSLAKELE